MHLVGFGILVHQHLQLVQSLFVLFLLDQSLNQGDLFLQVLVHFFIVFVVTMRGLLYGIIILFFWGNYIMGKKIWVFIITL